MSYTAKAPGRVNIIGEHIDYAGYSVLPCALSQRSSVTSTIVARLSSCPRMFIDNADGRYASRVIVVQDRLASLPTTAHIDWSDYVICGFAAALHLLGKPCIDCDIALTVDGDIPAGAGLSSSSALVVSSALSIFNTLKVLYSEDLSHIGMSEVAAACVESERLVGTMGGGMDQTVSCLAVEGQALHIYCSPTISVSPVLLPPGLCLVLAGSRVAAEKGNGAKEAFNTRVVESRCAAVVIAAIALSCAGVSGAEALTKVLGVRSIKDAELIYRKYVLLEVDPIVGISADIGILDSFLQFVRIHLHREAYSVSDVVSAIATALQVSREGIDLTTLFPTSPAAAVVLSANPRLLLWHRCVHTLQEASRVLQFRLTCEQEVCSSVQTRLRQLSTLGRLMTQSHASLRDLYDCSCPELDSLVIRALSCGAAGARLTGAGWGGMVVCLLAEEEAVDFMHRLRQSYYVDCLGMRKQDVDESMLFKTAPGPGAQVQLVDL